LLNLPDDLPKLELIVTELEQSRKELIGIIAGIPKDMITFRFFSRRRKWKGRTIKTFEELGND